MTLAPSAKSFTGARNQASVVLVQCKKYIGIEEEKSFFFNKRKQVVPNTADNFADLDFFDGSEEEGKRWSNRTGVQYKYLVLLISHCNSMSFCLGMEVY